MASNDQEEASTLKDLERIEVQGNTNALSRTMAVMILRSLPGVGGYYLDQWAGTQFFVLVGFLIGTCIAVYGMLYVAKIADHTAKRNRERRRQLESQSESDLSRK
jgi:F0F1-type ATP synthase assembly protein I